MLVFGHRLYGKVLACGDAHVATRFFHLWFVPLIPLQSVLVFGRDERGEALGLPTRMHWRSVLSGYLRGWSIFLLLHALLNGVEVAGMTEARVEGVAYVAAVSVVAVALFVLGWFVLPRVSPERRAQLLAYGRVFGHPVDVALLGDNREPFAQSLRAGMAGVGQQYAVNYRANYDPVAQWDLLAMDPAMRDPAYLTQALALARVESTLLEGEAGRARAQLHDRIWEKLVAVAPGVRAAA